MDGKKDVFGMHVGENESTKLWLSIMNGLKHQGVTGNRGLVDPKTENQPPISQVVGLVSGYLEIDVYY